MTRPLVVSAPGSLMLLGEHAVLHGHPCLVAAIEQRVKIAVIPRNDGWVTISSALGNYEGDRDDLPDHPTFRFAVGALRHLPDALPGGLDAMIQADMPPTIGFGTSAAVTAALVGALYFSAHGNLSLPDILTDARSVIQKVQGRGSGADAAASVGGGLVYYRMDHAIPDIISHVAHPVTALYCGYKTPTPEVIARVQKAWADRPEILADLYRRMGGLVEQGRAALRDGDDVAFGKRLNDGHGLLQELGVSTPELDQCAATLQNIPSVHGAKISGSGMGDCVIGWGNANASCSSFEQFDIMTAREGIRLE